MPSSAEILVLLSAMTRELAWLAITWHVVLLALAFAVSAGWHPSTTIAGLVLVALASSVAVAALGHGNPFNGLSFALLALALVVLAVARRGRPAQAGPTWAALLGVLLILYGAVYPHFVEGPWYRALYAAPVGVVPCPTLAVASGLTLVLGGLGSRALPAVLAVWTAFYAGFGMFRLGVTLDAGLVVAMVGLVALAVHNARRRAGQPAGARDGGAITGPTTARPILR